MSRSNVKILLVDDEEHLRNLYSSELKHHVNFVLTAVDGEDALHVLEREGDVDILITDLRMPNMNGMQLLERAKSIYPDLMTMVVTSNRDYESMSRALEYGVYDFIDKPLRMDIFAHKIANASSKIIQDKKRNKILEYLLGTITNQSMSDFYQMDCEKQNKILDAVQGLVTAKIIKEEVRRERR